MSWETCGRTRSYIPDTLNVVKRNLRDLKHEKSKNLSVLGETLELTQRIPTVTKPHIIKLRISIQSFHLSRSKRGCRMAEKKTPPIPDPIVAMPIAKPFLW